MEKIFHTVKASLGHGRTVRIKNFGTFEVTDRPGRVGEGESGVGHGCV